MLQAAISDQQSKRSEQQTTVNSRQQIVTTRDV
jgi:hypothetical protein